jgi:hypothetical protein
MSEDKTYHSISVTIYVYKLFRIIKKVRIDIHSYDKSHKNNLHRLNKR